MLPTNLLHCNFTGNSSSRTWGISSLIGKWASPNDHSANIALGETFQDMELLPSMIQLRDVIVLEWNLFLPFELLLYCLIQICLLLASASTHLKTTRNTNRARVSGSSSNHITPEVLL